MLTDGTAAVDTAYVSADAAFIARRRSGELQVGLQVPQRGREVLQVIREQSAIAELVDCRRIGGEEQLGDVSRLRKRVHPHVHALQVQQHARENLRLGRMAQQMHLDERFVLVVIVADRVAAQQLAACLLGQQRAAVERIDDQILRERQAAAGRTAQEKMTGEVDALDVEPRAPRDFHIQQRERNRDPGSAVEHLVEKAVAGILVLNLVADEAQLLEQVFVEHHDARVAIRIDARRRVARQDGRGRHAHLRLAAERVELIEVGPGVEFRVLDARDHQCRHGEVGVGAECRAREASNELLAHTTG